MHPLREEGCIRIERHVLMSTPDPNPGQELPDSEGRDAVALEEEVRTEFHQLGVEPFLDVRACDEPDG